MSLLKALARHPFLAGLPGEVPRALAGLARPERFAAGDLLLRQGQAAQRLFLLDSGEVVLISPVPHRGEAVVETLRGGEVLGLSWLLPPYQWHFDARARTPVAALALDAEALRRCMEADHELGYQLQRRILAVLLTRLQESRLQRLDVYAEPGREAPC